MSTEIRAPWRLCWMLFGATALSFLDRQVMSMLAPTLMSDLSMSTVTYSRVLSAFVMSYTIMFSVGGRVMDLLGTRRGLAIAVAIWSTAAAAHAAVTGAVGLGAALFLLGFGEGGCFPAATRGATEWFPPHKRALAIGIANGGSAFGAVIAPPLAVWLAARVGWRGAFLAVGLLGFVWVAAWQGILRAEPVPRPASRPKRVPVRVLLSDPVIWKVLVARFLFDPVFYFYMFWIPQYLSKQRGLSREEIGAYFWIPFLVLGLSTIASGRLSDLLVSRGWPVRRARMTLLVIAAAVTPVSWLTSLAPTLAWAMALMATLMLAHGLWITNYLGFLSDRFPSEAIATVTGLTGTAGGLGGVLSSLAVGRIVEQYSFAPVFAASAFVYPIAVLILLTCGGRAPLRSRLR